MTPLPFHGPKIHVVTQRYGRSDCSVACLAMLLKLPYEDVLVRFRHNVMAEGATTRQIQAVARLLGTPLRYRTRVDLEQDAGILCVGSKDWSTDHVVMLQNELVIDTDASVWDADVFLTAHNATANGLLVPR